MGRTSTFATQFRRRREGKTDYRKRIALAKSAMPRLAVRKSNKYITVQVIKYLPEGDRTLVHVNSRKLQDFGWKAGKKNLPAAYLTGLLAGTIAKKNKIESAILDIGFSTPVHGSYCFAALKGAIDAGLKINAGAEALPSDERLHGKHIEQFAAKLGPDAGKRFSEISKSGVDLKNIGALFEQAKAKILHGK